MRIPAGSLRSNIGLPYISQYVLRGCGSSVYSTLTAQPFLSAYLICAVICASVRSGRNENCPCVMRLPVLVIMALAPRLRHSGEGRDPFTFAAKIKMGPGLRRDDEVVMRSRLRS